MNPIRTAAFVSLLSFAALSAAQLQLSGSSTIAAMGGSVCATNAAHTSGWKGLQETARNATIQFSTDTGPSSGSTPPLLKFASDANTGAVVGNRYAYGSASSNGYGMSEGQSTVSSAGGNAPTYYNAPWGAQATDGSTTGDAAMIGTYDPFSVLRGDVSGLGSTVDLYYQTSLLQSYGGYVTGASAQTGQYASYIYDVYYTLPSGLTQSILSINFAASTHQATVFFGGATGVQLYLLDPSKATNMSLTPDDRISGLTPLTSTSAGSLAQYFTAAGALTRNLDFGIVYKGFSVPTTGSPTDVLLSWHTDTTGIVTPRPVPEPASFAALGLGALALLRRRRRA